MPLTDSPVEPWSVERSENTGLLRLFVGFAGLLWVTVALGILVVNHDGPAGASGPDLRIARWMADHRSTWITRIAELASFVGSSVVLIPAAAFAGVLIWRGTNRAGLAVLPVLALVDTEIVVQIAKRIVARPRPHPALASAVFDGYAWPSGHAASAVAAAASVWVVAEALSCPTTLRRRLGGTATFVAVLVVLSRVVLGAHWTTDVLMGGVVGIVVVMLLVKPLLERFPVR